MHLQLVYIVCPYLTELSILYHIICFIHTMQIGKGKALARSGELLIDLTTKLDLYGGSLSATGANIRNCGDCLAQAAAESSR